MNIYVDLIARQAVTSPTDATPAIRPDFRAATTYPINFYFLRQNGSGGYAYVRFPNSIIKAGIRSTAPVEVARFTLIFRGAETAEIDTRFSTDQIKKLLEALPTIGVGNVSVAIPEDSLVVEFTGALAGTVLPTMSARIVSSTPSGAELTIEVLPDGKQQLTLNRPPLAQTTTWTEVTIGTTPGWAGTLDTTTVPVSAWENPVGDIKFEVSLTALSARSGIDGATVSDAVGRSGVNGQVVTSPGTSGSALMSDNYRDSFLIATNSSTVYGRKFVPNDIGRVVTIAGYVSPNTTIAEVTDDGVNNMARLSQRFTVEGRGLGSISNYALDVLPSDVYYSATGNFTAADVGHVILGTNIPMNTRIIAVIAAQYVRLSQRPTAIGTALSWTLVSDVSFVFTSGLGLFQSGDVGATLRAPAILDGDATITKWISATQVQLDKRPKAATTGVQWTVIPVRPYPPAAVSRLISGDMATQEVQKIALAQAAVGGTLAVQDGYGGEMPLAVANNPVDTSDLQIALKQAYSNYGDLTVQEVVPGAEWNVIFGYTGGQRLLVVDESQATYAGKVLDMVVADKSSMMNTALPEVPVVVPTKVQRNGLFYIGADPNALSAVKDVGNPRVSLITDGTGAKMLRRRVMTFTDQYVPPTMNASYGGYKFIGDEGGQERNGLYIVEWVYVTVPITRVETHNQQRTILVPLYQRRGSPPNQRTIDVQLVSTSVSTFVDVTFSYWLEGAAKALPPDGPIAVVVHYSTAGGENFPPDLWTRNGFDPVNGSWNVKYTQSWSRRRWMGHIWEQKTFYN